MPTYAQLLTRMPQAGAMAMLLAAGRGKRMMPLTVNCPKPLLELQGRPIMEWLLLAMQQQGIAQVVVNAAWQGQKVHAYAAQANQTATLPQLIISDEGETAGLETAGGVVMALPKLATLFWLVAGDVYLPEFQFSAEQMADFASSTALAKIWLVKNPAHHPKGDFYIDPQGQVLNSSNPAVNACQSYTYASVGLFKQELFRAPWCDIAYANPQKQRLALVVLLRQAAAAGLLQGEIYSGFYQDVGTPQRLAELNNSQ